MSKKWIEIILNIVFWAATAWLIISSYSISSYEIQVENGAETVNIIRDAKLVFELSMFIGMSAVMFYTNIIIFSKYQSSLTKLIYRTVGLLILFIFIWFLLGVNYDKLPISISLGIVLFYYSISTVYGLSKNWLRLEAQKKQLLLEKNQYQLTILRNQLQPHFLFNALNNLLSMVDQTRTPALAESIEKLSSLLRYVVEENTADKVPIRKEIDFLKNYSELQLLRFEREEVKFEFDIKGEHDSQMIEPGIFVSFIENAFKYGTEPEQRSEINVSFDISKPNQVKFYSKNKIYHETLSINNPSTGISSVRKRLELVYPGKHNLKISKNVFFNVELEIETDESNNS